MNRNAFLTIAAGTALLLGGPSSLAASEPAKVAGTWELTVEGRQGRTSTQTLTIEQNGEKIKGTITGLRAESSFEGTVSGNKISFTSKRDTDRGEMMFEYSGTVDGDSMKGTMQFNGITRDWTARREKQKDKDKDKES
jgi:hypothetical protein